LTEETVQARRAAKHPRLNSDKAIGASGGEEPRWKSSALRQIITYQEQSGA